MYILYITVRMMIQMMALIIVSQTSNVSHLEEGLIVVDDSDKFTIARLKAE